MAAKCTEMVDPRDRPGQPGEFRPSYHEFLAYLEERPKRLFDMTCSYDCAGAACSGEPLNETYMGPAWFNAFQRRVCRGLWAGCELARELRQVGQSLFPQARPSSKKRKR